MGHFIKREQLSEVVMLLKNKNQSHFRAQSALRQSRTNEVTTLQMILIRFVYKQYCTPISGSLVTKHVTGSSVFLQSVGVEGKGG